MAVRVAARLTRALQRLLGRSHGKRPDRSPTPCLLPFFLPFATLSDHMITRIRSCTLRQTLTQCDFALSRRAADRGTSTRHQDHQARRGERARRRSPSASRNHSITSRWSKGAASLDRDCRLLRFATAESSSLSHSIASRWSTGAASPRLKLPSTAIHCHLWPRNRQTRCTRSHLFAPRARAVRLGSRARTGSGR